MLFHIINITIFILLLGSIFYIFRYQHIQNNKNKYQIIFDKLLHTTYPICVINLSTNRLDMSNSNFNNLFIKKNNDSNKLDAFDLDIFKDYETYLNLKNECLSNLDGTIVLRNTFNNVNHIYKVHYSLIKFGFKKYMVLSVEDKTNLVDYIKKLGLFTKIADNNKEGIIVVNFNRDIPIISYVNASIGSITGYSIQEVLNKPLAVLFESNVDENTLSNLYENLKNKTETTLEYQYFKKDGSICWIKTNMVPIVRQSVIDRLVELDNNKIDNIENLLDISDFDIYITLYQTDITDYKQNHELPIKAYMNKLSDYNRNVNKFFEIIDGLLDMSFMTGENNIHKTELLEQITGIVGRASDSNKCYIYKIIDEKMYLQYIWIIDNDSNNSNLIEGLSFEEAGLFKLYSNLIMNKPYYCNIESIKNNVCANQLFRMNDIKSSLIFPILKDNELIGFIGINSNEDREYSTNVYTLLEMVSIKLSNII